MPVDALSRATGKTGMVASWSGSRSGALADGAAVCRMAAGQSIRHSIRFGQRARGPVPEMSVELVPATREWAA